MNKRVFGFDLDGHPVLGFDTGLNSQGFAQAKLAQLLTHHGSIVYPNGEIETWLPGGVHDNGSMVIWGPAFPGEELTGIIDSQNRRDLPIDAQRRDEALDAIRYWLKARTVLEESAGHTSPFNGPAGAFIITGKNPATEQPYPAGTIFFPPAALVRRSLEADSLLGSAERWVHPDLDGVKAISFSAAVMLYRTFCGALPFSRDKAELLRQDMREGVFIPPQMAAPGIDGELAGLISMAMSRVTQGEDKARTPPEFFSGFFGPPSSRPVSHWVRRLSDEEKAKIRSGKERYRRATDTRTKTRRFVIRNAAIITAALIAFAAIMGIVQGINQRKAELPTTSGMSPVEVAEAYYGAFGTLDHTLMDACVLSRAGKQDIDMVVNLFVTSRARQAYEISRVSVMPAAEWLEAGQPETDSIVFGISDLKVETLSANSENTSLEATYLLWIPSQYLEDAEEEAPGHDTRIEATAYLDKLSLVFHRDAWRIAGIERNNNGAAWN